MRLNRRVEVLESKQAPSCRYYIVLPGQPEPENVRPQDTVFHVRFVRPDGVSVDREGNPCE